MDIKIGTEGKKTEGKKREGNQGKKRKRGKRCSKERRLF